MTKRIYGHIGAIIVIAIWGTTFVSSKVLLNSSLQPAEIFLYRFSIAYICMLIISHKRLWADSIKDELALLGMGVMGGSLYFLTENMALTYSTSSNVSILVSTTPLVTMLVVSLFYKSERMKAKQIISSFIAFAGVVLVVLNGQLVLHLNPKGDMLALAASTTWAFYSLLMRRVMSRYSSDFITRKVFAYGLLTILLYFIFITPLSFDIDILFQPVVLSNLLFLGFIASTAGYLLWNWVMKQLGAVHSSNYIYLQSFITMLAGSIILNEKITMMGIAGAVILILGMIGALRNGKKTTT